MPITVRGQVGPQVVGDGAEQSFRQGRSSELIVQELHGRFYEQVYRGNVYSNGMTTTALSANTITLNNTTTPILGVYNPSSSTVNVSILQAALAFHPNTLTTPAPPGNFVWASSIGNTAISTGTAPFNRKTLSSIGSQAKGMAFVALTGLTNNLVIFEGADFADWGATAAGTIVASTTQANFMSGGNAVQNFDGSLIVPPGGVLALLNVNSTTTYSVSGRLMWEEVIL
jgi:hypothetical protein